MRRSRKRLEDDTRTALARVRQRLWRRAFAFWISFVAAVAAIAGLISGMGDTHVTLLMLALGLFAAVVLYQMITKGRARELRFRASALQAHLSEFFVSTSDAPRSNRVFVIHGHDVATRDAVVGHLRKAGLDAVVIQGEAHEGLTILEKFEEYAEDNVDYAVAILTGDDVGHVRDGDPRPRARQNVIFELGYFMRHLARENISVIEAGHIEKPSDINGLGTISFDPGGGWKMQLSRELQAAGYFPTA